MALFSESLSASDGPEQAHAQDWEGLLQEWLCGGLAAGQTIPAFSAGTLTQKLYYWPLAAVLLGRAHRHYGFPRATILPFFTSLSAKIDQIFRERWEEESGLLFLLGREESLLEDSDFWAQAAPQAKIADPGFLALTIHALENLMTIGGQLDQDIRQLSQYYELLIHSANEQLWNEAYGIYLPYDLDKKCQIISDSSGGLLFWLADVPDQEQAEAMYRTLANNFVHPQHYYFPTSCVTGNAQSRTVRLLINYLLFFGLTRFDFGPTAKALRQHTQYLVEEYGGPHDFFDSNRNPDKKPTPQGSHHLAKQLWLDLQDAPLEHYSNREG